MRHTSNIKCTVCRAVTLLSCTMLGSLAAAQKISPVEDSPIRSYVLIDQFERTTNRYANGNRSEDGLRFNTTAWIGGDYSRLWIYAEGRKPYNGKLEDVDVQVLYGRLVDPFWDLQVGLRYFKPSSGVSARNYAVFGVQGMAPYRFGVQAAAFVSERGDVSARAELEYELLLTQRWILQPRFATNVALQEVREQGIGRGVNDIEFGLRLRYEIKREFAPYIGVSWQNRYGDAARFARDRGERVGGWNVVAGVRAWF